VERAPLAPADLKAFPPVQAEKPLMIYFPPLTQHQHVPPPITVARQSRCQHSHHLDLLDRLRAPTPIVDRRTVIVWKLDV
jgi:hypothetical protein